MKRFACCNPVIQKYILTELVSENLSSAEEGRKYVLETKFLLSERLLY